MRNNNQCFTHGDEMQEVFVHYMESLGYEFLGGDRNGFTRNIDYIEEITHSIYQPPIEGVSGPMLRILCKDGISRNFVMPDELMMKDNNGKHQLFDVKNRKLDNLREHYGILDDYRQIGYSTGIPVFVSLVIWNKNNRCYEIYCRNVNNVLSGYDDRNCHQNTWIYFDLENFKKI